jgi:hypothetical protein
VFRKEIAYDNEDMHGDIMEEEDKVAQESRSDRAYGSTY